MTLTPVEYTVVEGPDGQHWLSRPDGTRSEFSFLPVENLRVTDKSAHSMAWAWSYEGTGHTGFDAELHVPGIYDVWTSVAILGPAERNFAVESGLPDDTQIGFRIRATDERTPG